MIAKRMIFLKNQNAILSVMMASGHQKNNAILTVTLKVVPDVLFLLSMIVLISWARLLFAS